MAQHAETHANTTTDCFQCVLDPETKHNACAVPVLNGLLIGAYERVIDNQKVPIIGLNTDMGRVDIHLTDYYQKFVRELHERGTGVRDLHIRLYHLPHPSTTAENKGKARLIFSANTYTLAVLEPDVLLNITDLSQADYCPRQYLLGGLVTSPPNAATLRGNLIHHCFKELLKAHGRHPDEQDEEAPLTTLERQLELALQQNGIDLALAHVSQTAMREEVQPHLESLAAWYQEQRATLWDLFTKSKHSSTANGHGESEVSAETFLLAPEIGLKGRLDLYWQQATRQRLLELKTGGASGDVPKSGHRKQVNGYSALLTVRRNKMEKAEATLLYSGTPAQAESRRISFSIRELQRAIETRNLLIIDHLLGVPAAPPGPSRCTKCMLLPTCTTVSSLLNWQPPEPAPDVPMPAQATPLSQLAPDNDEQIAASLLPKEYSESDRAFFRKFYDLLRLEGLESERLQALLWTTSPEERVERGTAITQLTLIAEKKTGNEEWEQTFACTNTSELREGDEVLLSDGDPIKGAVVTGTIIRISTHEVTLWMPERIANPALIDRNENNLVHTRTLKNLLRWLETSQHLRQLVAGNIRPRFTTGPIAAVVDARLNAAQQLAVKKALRMQDYLLIQGPPGTGKTSVIAAIVKQLCAQGQRVMLVAFTNQAVDNMLRRLDAEGFSDYVRLGHDRSVHVAVQRRLLKNLLAQPEANSLVEPGEPAHDAVREILNKGQVVASTTATWSSEKYAAPTFHGPAAQTEHAAQLLFQFDVAIIDEASQLTIPALLGAIRLAKRFILVGDDKQLPPLVLSKEAAEQGLSESLFHFLKQRDDDYRETHATAESACVSLQLQYRMNPWISYYSSVVFYEKQLIAADFLKRQLLEVQPVKPATLTEEPLAISQAIEPAHPLVFLDVRPVAEVQSQQRETKSNTTEAQAIRALVQGLLARGITEQQIGIIAPFRAQVATIRRVLFTPDEASDWRGISSDTPMLIDTVDRFQGGERTVIIMSFTVAYTLSTNSPLRDFLLNPNRLNVALTRAQRKLLLVGCVPALETLPYYDRLLTYCRSMKTVISYELTEG